MVSCKAMMPSEILHTCTYMVKQWSSSGHAESKTISLNLQSVLLILSETISKDILYQTSTYFKAVDFIAVMEKVLGPDDVEREYLVAIQVTAQKSAIKAKFEATKNITCKVYRK